MPRGLLLKHKEWGEDLRRSQINGERTVASKWLNDMLRIYMVSGAASLRRVVKVWNGCFGQKERESTRREKKDFRAGLSQAGAGAHQHVKESASTMLCSRTQ